MNLLIVLNRGPKIEGARVRSMKELYNWIEEADKVITF